MRWLAVVVVLLGCHKPDECTRLKQKVRPLIAGMAQAAHRPVSDAQLDQLSAEFCKPPASESDRRLRQCLLEAADQPAAAACLQKEFEAYAGDVRHAGGRGDGGPADSPRLALDAGPRDAGTADAAAAPPARAAVDPASLPEWPVPPHAGGGGPPTEIYAVDEDADRLMTSLWSKELLLAPAVKVRVTGRVKAASRAAALAALVAEVHFAPRVTKVAGHGPTVDFSFGGAPQADLFAVLADVMHLPIVAAPGELPDVDVSMRRVPAEGVLGALAALDGRTVVRAGHVAFLVEKGAKLPPLPELAATRVFDVTARDATAPEIVAALRAVIALPIDVCGGSKIVHLRLAKITAAEAARALAVASGGTLQPSGTCTPKVTEKLPADLADARLVVVVRAGPDRVAVVAHAGTDVLVRNPGTNDDGTLVVAGYPAVFPGGWQPPPQQLAAWLAQVRRTSSIVHEGSRWIAHVETATGHVLIDSTMRNLDLPLDLVGTKPTITPAGVELDDPRAPGAKITIPLAR